MIKYIKGTRTEKACYKLKCACGKNHKSQAYRVMSGLTTHCRKCADKNVKEANRLKWGFVKYIPNNKLRASWLNRHAMMMKRCYARYHKSFEGYGGRGITVCERWHDRLTFIKDISEMEGHDNLKLQLDRVDNDKNYCPENCEIVTRSVNCKNRRNSIKNRPGDPPLGYDEEPF